MTETIRKRPEVSDPDYESFECGRECACYARLSDVKLGRESSIPDQVRQCREEARRDGGFIPDSNIFADIDVRGITESRPALDRLLDLVRSGTATFTDLYISDTSRLARSSSFAPKLRNFFKSHGIRLHFVENGMKSGNAGFDLQHTFQSYFDELYSEQLREKVLRGQVGLVERGYLPSGKCYGYQNVPEEHPTQKGKWGRPKVIGVKQVPFQKEVDVILDICNMYANGEGGYLEIARRLRDRGVDSPRKGAKNEGIGWSESAVARILNNERYIGRATFGKMRKVRDPETLKVSHKKRDESEWKRHHDPSLQIIPDELWERVKARQALVRDKIGAGKVGGTSRTPARTYLFGGLLYCGVCESPMTLTHDRYKCRKALRKFGCDNHRVISRESLETQMLEALASIIRSETHLTEIKSLFMSELAEELKREKALEGDAVSKKQVLTEEKRQLESQLKNLAEEIANFGGDDELRDLRRTKRARLKTVTEMLERAERPATTTSDEEIDAFLRNAFENLADVLLGDPIRSKQELLKRVTSLTLTPVDQVGEPAFVLSGDLTLFTEEETLQLPRFGTKTGELQPLTFKLDGMVLALDSRGNILSITAPRACRVENEPERQVDLVENDPAIAA